MQENVMSVSKKNFKRKNLSEKHQSKSATGNPTTPDLRAEITKDPYTVEPIYAMANDPSPESVAILLDVVTISKQLSPFAVALGKIATKSPHAVSQNVEAMDFLIDLLLHGESGMQRANAAFALGWTGSSKAIEPLRSATNDDDDAVRENAKKALSQLGAS